MVGEEPADVFGDGDVPDPGAGPRRPEGDRGAGQVDHGPLHPHMGERTVRSASQVPDRQREVLPAAQSRHDGQETGQVVGRR